MRHDLRPSPGVWTCPPGLTRAAAGPYRHALSGTPDREGPPCVAAGPYRPTFVCRASNARRDSVGVGRLCGLDQAIAVHHAQNHFEHFVFDRDQPGRATQRLAGAGVA